METENIPVYCMSCKKHMSGPEGDYDVASHGLCPECLTNFMEEFEKTHPGARAVFNNVKIESLGGMTFKEFVMRKLMK